MWLNKRRESILIKLIDIYISTHNFVNSNQLKEFFSLASSSIRKELQELEKQKYITKLHVSSGRIPTNKGLKYYINKLLMDKNYNMNSDFRTPILRGFDFNDISQEVLLRLSNSTNNLGFILLGSLMDFRFKEIRFIKISAYKVMAIIKSKNNWNYTKSFLVSKNYSEGELNNWAFILNNDFTNHTLAVALKKIRNRIFTEKVKYLSIYKGLFYLLKNKELLSAEFISKGEENIFNFGMKSTEEMRQLLHILEEKERFTNFVDDLLNKTTKKIEPIVVFGNEFGGTVFNELMVVFSGFFSKDKKRLGNVGIIGPRYMEYANVFSKINSLSNYFSAKLSDH